MIVMDPPRFDTFRGKRITTAHLVSTLPGAEGTAELVAFAKSIGMLERWIQYRGEPKEHFDLMGNRCERAVKLGAVVSRLLVGATIRAKREGRAEVRWFGHRATPGSHAGNLLTLAVALHTSRSALKREATKAEGYLGIDPEYREADDPFYQEEPPALPSPDDPG
jgi:hypothetical protein